MADFRKSACCSCSENKTCSNSFTEFASELCPKSAKCVKSAEKK